MVRRPPKSHSRPLLAELEPIGPDEVFWCRCSTVCASARAHPLGRRLAGPEVNPHFVERAEKELGLDLSTSLLMRGTAVGLVGRYRGECSAGLGAGAMVVALGPRAGGP